MATYQRNRAIRQKKTKQDTGNAYFVWLQTEAGIRMAVRPMEPQLWQAHQRVEVANVTVPLVSKNSYRIVYQCPTTLRKEPSGRIVADSVFAILAGGVGSTFAGSRLNFRDVIEVGKEKGKLVYILPAGSVRQHDAMWEGYVRLGFQSWIRIPVPHPEAVYNRIPNRLLERQPVVRAARLSLLNLGIPVFNQEYFSKANIYHALSKHGLEHCLPETQSQLTNIGLRQMLSRHQGVYLKPSGGSVGHGMIRIQHRLDQYRVQMLRDGKTNESYLKNVDDVWRNVQQQKVKGRYVVQAAVPLLTWQGNPCDFRVLLQKSAGDWKLVGRGVRVCGPNKITTHVPSGGSIANAASVLGNAFGLQATKVDQELTRITILCAKAIDSEYGGKLGEMSMDIGIDESGRPWFFEANAKPMKFDEPDIRRRSLVGILDYMQELARPRIMTSK